MCQLNRMRVIVYDDLFYLCLSVDCLVSQRRMTWQKVKPDIWVSNEKRLNAIFLTQGMCTAGEHQPVNYPCYFVYYPVICSRQISFYGPIHCPINLISVHSFLTITIRKWYTIQITLPFCALWYPIANVTIQKSLARVADSNKNCLYGIGGFYERVTLFYQVIPPKSDSDEATSLR
jgi:hypothetical protein